MTRFIYLLKRLLLALMIAVGTIPAFSQVVTTAPSIVQQSSDPIVITFHADRGNGGLKGLGANVAVYAHTGVVLEGSDEWSYAPTWGTNTAKYKMTYVSPNTYTLTIDGIANYYGVPAGKKVSRLAFVFRNASGSAEGKTADGGDIFVEVAEDGLAIKVSGDTDPGLLSTATDVKLKVETTQAADISLYLDSSETSPIASASGVKQLEKTVAISSPGTYTYIATATAGGKTVTDAVSYTLAAPSSAAVYPGGVPVMGPVTNDDGTATFCIAAPGKNTAMIVGAWNDYALDPMQVMSYQDYQDNRYFWITLPGLNTGEQYPYYFIFDNTLRTGDPYARLVLDPWSDKYIPESVYPDMIPYPSAVVEGVPLAVYCSKPSAYRWQVDDFKRPDQSRLVIYELLIRDFTGTEGQARGNGTIQGVIDKLDYLKRLGVNAIELLPIMEFNGNNSWGYNTNFYFAPDKAYGTPDDYRRLIDETHRRGMAVILDIVFNQTDGLHPWYQMYPPKSNPFYNASAPHAYSVLNDWNQDNPLVQQQFRDALKYWLTEYRVDGFRFDLVKGLGSNQSYGATYNPAQNTWSGVTDAKTNAYNATRVARMKELHDAMREVDPEAYFINENLAGAKEENEMAADGEINWANVNEASCQFAMGFSSNSNMNRFYAPLDSRTWGSTVSYAESHDEERLAYKISKYGNSAVKSTEMSTRRLGSVAAMMLMTPGAHMIWQFQEFGADQTTKDSGGGNNTSPKKVIWNYLNNQDREGLMENYVTLNALRNDNPEMFAEGVTTTVQCAVNNWNQGRFVTLKSGQKAIYLAVNPNVSATATLTIPGMDTSVKYQLLASSYNVTPTLSGNSVTLPAGAFAVYGTMDIADAESIDMDLTDNVRIYAVDNRIIVEGNCSSVNVYDLAGRRYNANQPLRQGVYVVKADDTTAKVLIR